MNCTCLPFQAIKISSRNPSNPSRGSRARSGSGSRGLQHQFGSYSYSITGGTSNANSLSSQIASWTKKVQGSIVACGAPESLAEAAAAATTTTTASRESRDPPADKHHHYSTMRRTRSNLDKRSRETKQSSGQKRTTDDFDHDHNTLATDTTASATISYSTDQGDDASEMGMEVIMSGDGNSPEGMEATVASTGFEPYRSHSFPAGKHTFTVDQRYSMIRTIGSGAYGVVISASDSKFNRNVAIKMVPKAFSDEVDAKRILREIKLLKHFNHENIVQLVDMMPPNVQYLEDYRDVYLITDLMETDLHRIIYSKQKLSIDHVQYFIYQVLRGLKYIHSCNVLHRDLKPSNLLVNSNCDLKICDFGLARGIHEPLEDGRASTMLLTEYVVTRWYRAPEIMLACHEYSYPIDVWSVGCIFAELILRKPYFPGDDYIDQVSECVHLITLLDKMVYVSSPSH